MSLSVAPLAYLYVRSTLAQSFRFKKWDFLFFLPAIFYTAQFIPFYILPAKEKLFFIESALQNKSFGIREPEGLLPAGLGFIFRMSYSLSLTIATCVLLIQFKRSDRSALLKVQENKEIFEWLFYLCIVLFLTFFVLIIGYFFQLTSVFEKFKISTLTVTFTIFFISVYLFFKPNILYGLKGWMPLQRVTEELQTIVINDQLIVKRQSISIDQGVAYKSLIENHFKTKSPFLKHRYTIRDLGEEIEVPTYLISAFINQEYGTNFSDFVNDTRVAYLIELVKNEPDYLTQYTLSVLGEMGGFKSRSTFIAAVKRKTGKTPSEIFGKKMIDLVL
jgi:AraC-like DNA-binding protein